MSAEPARTQPPYVLNKGEPAPVIDLNRRRPGAPQGRGRWAAMTTPGGTPDQPDNDGGGEARRALEAWADSIETSYLEICQTLTDPQTAATFLRALDVFERTLQGAHAGGVIDDKQLEELTGLIAGLREVPRLI